MSFLRKVVLSIATVVVLGGCQNPTSSPPITYTLTYNGNGATGGTVPVDSNRYQQGHAVAVAGNAGSLSQEGYAFAGWNTKADGSGNSYSASAVLTFGSADVTLYAMWNQLYSMTYDGNGAASGTVPVDSGQYFQGSTVRVASNTGFLSKLGYSFAGWNTKADGSGNNYGASASFSMPSENMTLYARWTNSTSGDIEIVTPEAYTVVILGGPRLYVGVAATFTSTYTGNASSYQWCLNGIPILGAMSSTLTYTQDSATAYFGVNQLLLEVTDTSGVVYSGTHTFTVIN